MKIRDGCVDDIYIRTCLWIMYLWSLRSVILFIWHRPGLALSSGGSDRYSTSVILFII